MNEERRRAVLRCAAAAALFGATTPVAAGVASQTSAPVLAGLLYLGAAGAVMPIVLRRPLDRQAVTRSARPLLAAVVAGGFFGPLLLAAGLARTPAATASLLLNLELVATTCIAAAFFAEHLGRRVLAGTALVTLAGLVLAWSGSIELRLGALLIVGACLCWGIDSCITARMDELAAEHITLTKGLIAGSTNLAVGLALSHRLPSTSGLVVALLAGGLGYGASITLWVSGARQLGAARAQLVFSTAPFVGVVVAWVVYQDPMRGVELVALALAGIGVSMAAGSDHAHTHRHEPLTHRHEHTHDEHHHHHGHDGPVDIGHDHHHRHRQLVHSHPHLPDLHHRHDHDHDLDA